MYQVEMPYRLFESLKRKSSNHQVEILELTQSTYKKQEKVNLCELEDWSIARNIEALRRN